MTRRILIIGNGAAGISSAEMIRSLDPAARILILTDEPFPFYSRPGIAYLLTGALPENQLFARSLDEYRRLRIGLAYGRVRQLNCDRHEVVLADGRRMTYDRLLLATGAGAILPDIPGNTLKGIVTFDTLEDARRILRLARNARRAVVSGGGITAVELAEGLAARGVETHYLLRKDRFWSQVLDPDESHLVEEGLAQEGVILHRQTTLKQLIGRRGRVAGAVTASGDLLPCEIVAFAIGTRPRLELAHSAGIETDQGILVDEHLRTSAQDVFAAGDVAQVYDPRSGKCELSSLWPTAIEQGRTSGINMAGHDQPYEPDIPFNVARIGGIITTIIGPVGQEHSAGPDLVSIVRSDCDAWPDPLNGLSLQSSDGSTRIRILLGERYLLGAVIMGGQIHSRLLQELIRGCVDIQFLRQDLLRSPQQAIEILSSAFRVPELSLVSLQA